MDFHSLLRRDLQFLCKRNKIPANMTNLAMADALNSLEIVEGLDEYMNQSDSNVLQSPATVAKLPPSTAARTTRRKTAAKAEPQSRSSRLMSKSLDGEMDQENVVQEQKINKVNVAKTPAARSTRKASCSSKVQESKKGELVQSAYSTRRSTRLLEKCMADLSLVTKETEQQVSTKEKNPAGSEEGNEDAEVIPGRDLSASMEKEWEMLEDDSDKVTGGLEMTAENTETVEVMTDEKESEKSLVQGDEQEETMQANEAICEEGSKKNDNDHEIIDVENSVDLYEIPVLEHANTETNNENKELMKDIQAFESLGQVDHLETEQAIEENDSEPEEVNTFHEETVVNQTDGDSGTESEEDDSSVDADEADHQETEQAILESDSKTEKINTFHEETVVDQTDGDSETQPEKDDYGVDSENTISEADSNQADHQETEQSIEEKDSETVKINTFDEATMVNQTEPEEDDSGVDSDDTISEADSNQAVQGSDIAEEEMILSELEGSVTSPSSPSPLLEEAEVKTASLSQFEADSNQTLQGSDIAEEDMIRPESEGSVTAPISPSPLLEEAKVKTAPLSPFAAESISTLFPRPNKSASTTPSKNSAMKLVSIDNNNKENNMEMMVNVVVNNSDNGEINKAEAKKKVEFDEENLKNASMRKLVKLVKELSIKGNNNRTALQMLPGNNQIAE